jgi:pyrophosphatase PpaX
MASSQRYQVYDEGTNGMSTVTRSLQEIDTLLFDLDGTLIDSRDFLMKLQFATLEKHYPGSITYERVCSQFGIVVFPELVRKYDSAGGQRVIEEFSKAKINGYHTSSPPFPGVLAGLRALKENGCKLGVVTNQQRDPVLNAISHCGLADLFDTVITLDDAAEAKPSPAGVLQALEQMGADPAKAAMIGDSDADILAGRRAGIASVLLQWYGEPEIMTDEPDLVCRSFEELLAALERNG